MLGVSEIKYLGQQISARVVMVLAINQYPRPNNLRSLRRFLVMVGFYASFIPGFSELADVLHALKRKGVTLLSFSVARIVAPISSIKSSCFNAATCHSVGS